MADLRLEMEGLDPELVKELLMDATILGCDPTSLELEPLQQAS